MYTCMCIRFWGSVVLLAETLTILPSLSWASEHNCGPMYHTYTHKVQATHLRPVSARHLSLKFWM